MRLGWREKYQELKKDLRKLLCASPLLFRTTLDNKIKVSIQVDLRMYLTLIVFWLEILVTIIKKFLRFTHFN